MHARLAAGIALVLAWTGLAAAAAADPAEDVARAEALGLAIYHEGFPPEYGESISAAGAERLAELLADPSQGRFHATLIEALAHAARPGAYEALASYAAARSAEETLDGDGYRAMRALPVAMGHLARRDDRALAWLLDRAQTAQPAPAAGSRAPEQVAERLQRQALYGLGLSGRPEALPALREAAAAPDARAARRALELHGGAVR